MSKQQNLYTFDNNSNAPRKRVWGRRVRTLASLLLLTLMTGQAGAEAGSFTTQSLRGHWGFSGSGTISPPVVPMVTWGAVVGVMTFDGIGECSISQTLNNGGITISQTSKICTYTVDPNGAGAIEALFPDDPGPLPLSFVLVDGGKEFQMIRTDVAVAVGVAKKQ
jgi:hypothetical protein